MPPARPILVDRQHVGIGRGEPGGLRGGGRRQAGEDPVFRQQVHHPIEPSEGEGLFVGLQRDPAKHPHRGHIDAGQSHQPHIFLPDRLAVVAERGGPLLRIIVAAKGEPWQAGAHPLHAIAHRISLHVD